VKLPEAMELERRVVNGLAWASGARVLQQLIQFAALIVVARILSPDLFGVVAVAAAFVGFLTLVAEFGFGAALVQQQVVTEEQRSTIFWGALGAAFVLVAVSAAVAPLLAEFMREPRLVTVTRALSFTLLFTAVGIVPRAVLQRAMAFSVIARIDALAALCGAVAAVMLVVRGAGVWSIVAQTVVTGIVASTGYAWRAEWRPRARFSLVELRSVGMTGAGIAGFNAVNFGARNFDDLIVGRLLGTYALGLYGRAYMLMLLPVTQISAATAAVLLPAVAATRSNPRVAAQLYLRVVQIGCMIALPVLAGILLVSDSLVPLLFGSHWEPMVPVLRILCLAGVAQLLLAPCGVLYQATGATRKLFLWGCAASAVTVGAFILGAWLGSIEWVAWCYLIAMVLLLYPGLAYAGRLVQLSAADMLRVALRPMSAAAGMAVVVVAVTLVLPPRTPQLQLLLIQSASGILAYAGLAWRLCPEPLRLLVHAWSRGPADAGFSRQPRTVAAAPVQVGHE
jgi:O-antigen/teichoic acid export membrane protein